MLGGIHMTKAVLHAIGKDVKGSGLDHILKYTKIYGPKALESVVVGTHHVRSLRGFKISSISIQTLKMASILDGKGPVLLSGGTKVCREFD